jgi:hypothetical protein
VRASLTGARVGRGLFVVFAVGGLGTPPACQAQEWRFEALGGRYRYQGSPVGAADGTAMLGIRYVEGASWVGALAGVPLTATDAPWGALTSSLRLTRGRQRLRWGVRLTGQAFVQGTRVDSVAVQGPGPPIVGNVPLRRRGPLGGGIEPSLSGWGASGEITPLVTLWTPRMTAEARVGVAAFHSDFADLAFDRSVVLAHMRVSGALAPSLVVSAEAVSHWAQEGTYPYLGGSALLAEGSLQAWASVGTWLARDVTTIPWALGTSVAVGERVSLTGSVRRDAFDPLFQTPDRTSWSVGVSFVLGRAPAPRAPVPTRYEAGIATITLRADQAVGEPSVAGDFNDWKPQAMTLRDGQWTLGIRLGPGVYYYSFVSSDGAWFVPESVAGRKPDGFGGHVAVLVVG